MIIIFLIQKASILGWIEVVKLLLADPSAFDNFALEGACNNGHVETVKLLLADSRVDPSAEFNIAIKSAIRKGHTEIVKLLLADPRVDLSNEYQAYILSIAREIGHTAIVNLLENYIKRKQEREAGQEGETKRLKMGRALF